MKRWMKGAVASMHGRNRIIHVILWLLYIGIAIEIVQTRVGTTSVVLMPMQILMFGLHEMSHVATGFLPDVITASAGSLSELLFAGLAVCVAYKKRAYITTLFMGLWWQFAAFSAGRYMADARSQLMPLVSIDSAMNEDGIANHDWHFVFERLGILHLDTIIGTSFKALGIIVVLFGLLFYAYLIFKINSSVIAESENLKTTDESAPKHVVTTVYSSDPINKEE